MQVPYSYLARQFADVEAYLDDIRAVVASGDFTLGAAVSQFEENFARLIGLDHVIGVASGTDALMLALKAVGVGPGDEVITAPNTFVATVGAIVMTGARPVFVDVNEVYAIDTAKIEAAITPRTKAIMPVHLSGNPADLPAVMEIAERRGLAVIEDAAQAILAKVDGKHVGSFGAAAGFSLHPLKNLNVWGDGGLIATTSAEMAEKLRLWRNHGLKGRDEVAFYAHNSRLDSLQAVVGNRLLGQVEEITARRIANARRFDEAFRGLAEFITIPPRDERFRQVFHTYVIQAEDRDALLQHLLEAGVRAKVHYPIPLHLQEASKGLGYCEGDFPVCEEQCRRIITLPVHQHLTEAELDYVTSQVRKFYLG
ncbi:MAG: DegT/DnrJ/EryC1/StrS family aminotransferase [Deltaproteobacteria bacterium]|nr:DegT/DnrJ/EryC1/StrS family aminotransferase [Deltaproteobacteria bacterium]